MDIKKDANIRKAALDFVESLSEESERNRTDIHFSEDNLVKWLIDFVKYLNSLTV